MKRIAFITDIHLDEPSPRNHPIEPYKNLDIVLTDIAQRDIGEIVFGGDIGAGTAHSHFFASLSPFKLDLVLGNHDKNDEVRPYFDRGIDRNELYYKSEEMAYDEFFLDSSSNSISIGQLKWLQQEMKADKDIVLFIHHPILPIACAADRAFHLGNRDQLVSLLRDVDRQITVFCGHYHMNDDQVLGNIRQICTQSMAFQLVKESPEISVDSSLFGYRIIELSENALNVQSIEFRNGLE